jgi:hypothetical protein
MMKQLDSWGFKQNDSPPSTKSRSIEADVFLPVILKKGVADHAKRPLALPFLVVSIALAFSAAV